MDGQLRELTPGEKAVGLTFNPSGDETVAKLKALFAEAFDIVEGSVDTSEETPAVAIKRKLRDAALAEIITAQMWSVKVVTFKD